MAKSDLLEQAFTDRDSKSHRVCECIWSVWR